jgi:hypothetical protein
MTERQWDSEPPLTYLENGSDTTGASAMTMWPTAAMIDDYLEERLPDKNGEIHVGFTSKQRDQIVATLRLREAAELFIAFAKNGSFKLFGDDFVLTSGSRLTHRQLSAGDFRALLAAAGEEEA